MKDHGIIELYDWDTQELSQYVKKYDIFNFKSFIMCVELVSRIDNEKN